MMRMLLLISTLGLLPTAVQARKANADDLESVRTWVRAVASENGDAVARATAFPFVHATTGNIKKCEGRVAGKKDLSQWLTCVRRDDLLMGELREGDLLPSGPPNAESRGLKKLASKIHGPGRWIEAFINGDGVTYTFRFLLRNGWVAAFLLDAEFETG